MSLWLALAVAAAGTLERPEIWLDFEVVRRDFGTYRVHPAGPLGEPMECPTVPARLGPVMDGETPFRTWTDVAFEPLRYRMFSGRHGVGFSLALVWPEAPTDFDPSSLGINGTVRFDGTVTVVVGKSDPASSAAVWSRGFEHRTPGQSEHADVFTSTAPVHREGRYGPYRWVIDGTLSAEMHLWAAPLTP